MKRQDWDCVEESIEATDDGEELSLNKLAVESRDAEGVETVKVNIVLGVVRKLMEEGSAVQSAEAVEESAHCIAEFLALLKANPITELSSLATGSQRSLCS